MKKNLVVLVSILVLFVFPVSVFAGSSNFDVSNESDWEDDFIEGCRANSGLPFEWDYGIGCDFETEEDVFCTYDDQCDAGWLLNLDTQKPSRTTSGDSSECENGEMISIASVGANGGVSIEEVCATGITTIAREEEIEDFPLEDLLNVEITTAGQKAKKPQTVALENDDDYSPGDFSGDCELAGGTPETSRMPNGDFYYECRFDDGDIIACDNFGCYPTPDSGFKVGFPKLNALEAIILERAVAISDDDLDDLNEACELDGGDGSSTSDGGQFFCVHEDTAWYCEDDFWSEGGLKCEPIAESDDKKSQTDLNGFPGEALKALEAVTINVAIKDEDLDDLNEVCELDGGDGSQTSDGGQFFCIYEDSAWFCKDDSGADGGIKCEPIASAESNDKKSETDLDGFPSEALNALDAVNANVVFVPRVPKISNPVLLVQETSCKVSQPDEAVQSSARIFLNNAIDMNGFFESIVGQNGIIAPNNLTGQPGSEGYQGTDGADISARMNIIDPNNIIAPNNLTLGDISDGTSKTLFFNIIAPNNAQGRPVLDGDLNEQNNIIAPNNLIIPFPGGPIPIPYPFITILATLGLGLLAGGLYLNKVSTGMKIMDFIVQQPKQLAMGAGVGFGVSILTAGIGLAALFFMSNTAPENIAVGCNAVVVQTAKLDYLIAQPEEQPEKKAEVLTVTAKQPSNCRRGAGTHFAKVGSFGPADDPAIVLGRNATAEWYFIEKNASQKCWVWADGLEDVSHLGEGVEEVGNPTNDPDDSSDGGEAVNTGGDSGGSGGGGGGGGGGGIGGIEPPPCFSCGGVVDPGGGSPPIIVD